MKKIINAIKNYIKDYENIQAIYMQTPGYNYFNAQMLAMAQGYAFF